MGEDVVFIVDGDNFRLSKIRSKVMGLNTTIFSFWVMGKDKTDCETKVKKLVNLIKNWFQKLGVFDMELPGYKGGVGHALMRLQSESGRYIDVSSEGADLVFGVYLEPGLKKEDTRDQILLDIEIGQPSKSDTENGGGTIIQTKNNYKELRKIFLEEAKRIFTNYKFQY